MKTKRSNRDRILDIASEMFLTNGFFITSMDDLVTASGVAKTNIYYHFKSKEELLGAIVDRMIAHYQSLASHIAILEDLSVPAKLERLLHALFEQNAVKSSLGGCPFLTLYMQTAGDWPEGRARIGQFFQDQRALVERLLKEGTARGDIHPALPPEQLASVIVASVEGALFLSHATEDDRIKSHLLDSLRLLVQPSVTKSPASTSSTPQPGSVPAGGE
ncbi:TetR/AcrR family transcriptional regulator [Paenibacillus puerhi]|uniref:TetR/AcrR family transcriptional regulator n=1 Tax=Paenibacillus puerhi TaxID=2692622 RepID=UPI001359DBBE|nr:TetR/AcrR family transcriptional regulator [Paenibacillus puerhi]